MSIGRRIATLFRVKANKALDRAEDPREMLDYSYEQQLEMVQKVRRGLADVATSRKRGRTRTSTLPPPSANGSAPPAPRAPARRRIRTKISSMRVGLIAGTAVLTVARVRGGPPPGLRWFTGLVLPVWRGDGI